MKIKGILGIATLYLALALVFALFGFILLNAKLSEAANPNLNYALITYNNRIGNVYYTPECFRECHLPVNISVTQNTNIPNPASFTSLFRNKQGLSSDKLRNWEFKILQHKTTISNLTRYSNYCSPYAAAESNMTIVAYSNCTVMANGTYLSQKEWDEWEPYEPSGKTLQAGTSYVIDLVGYRDMGRYNVRNVSANAVDAIPKILGEELPFAWWNSSWNNCANWTIVNNMAKTRMHGFYFFNFTSLTNMQADGDDIRIVSGSCNVDATEIRYDLYTNTATSAYVLAELDVPAGVTYNYSIYWSNDNAQKPAYTGTLEYSSVTNNQRIMSNQYYNLTVNNGTTVGMALTGTGTKLKAYSNDTTLGAVDTFTSVGTWTGCSGNISFNGTLMKEMTSTCNEGKGIHRFYDNYTFWSADINITSLNTNNTLVSGGWKPNGSISLMVAYIDNSGVVTISQPASAGWSEGSTNISDGWFTGYMIGGEGTSNSVWGVAWNQSNAVVGTGGTGKHWEYNGQDASGRYLGINGRGGGLTEMKNFSAWYGIYMPLAGEQVWTQTEVMNNHTEYLPTFTQGASQLNPNPNTAPAIQKVVVEAVNLDSSTDIRIRINASDGSGQNTLDACNVSTTRGTFAGGVCTIDITNELAQTGGLSINDSSNLIATRNFNFEINLSSYTANLSYANTESAQAINRSVIIANREPVYSFSYEINMSNHNNYTGVSFGVNFTGVLSGNASNTSYSMWTGDWINETTIIANRFLQANMTTSVNHTSGNFSSIYYVDRIKIEVNGTNYTATKTGNVHNITFNSSTAPTRTDVNYTARIWFNFTNTAAFSTSETDSIVVDSTKPEPAITKLFSGDAFLLPYMLFNITTNATDEYIKNLTFKVLRPAGTANQTWEITGNSTLQFNLTAAYVTGNYTLNLTARDMAGNEKTVSAYLAVGRINVTLPVVFIPLNYTTRDTAFTITNDTRKNLWLEASLTLIADGFLDARTKTIQFNLSQFGNYSFVNVTNSNSVQYSHSFSGSNATWTSQVVSTGQSLTNKITTQVNESINFSYSKIGSNYRYLVLSRPSLSYNEYLKITLPAGAVFDSNNFHPRYWICTAGITADYGCAGFTTGTDVTSTNNGANEISGYSVNMFLSESGTINYLTVQTNQSDWLMEVAIISGAFTPSSGEGSVTLPAGGGGGGGAAEPVPELNITDVLKKIEAICPDGYELTVMNGTQRCKLAAIPISEFEKIFTSPIAGTPLNLFSVTLLGIAGYAAYNVTRRRKLW